MSIELIKPKKFDFVSSKTREFFIAEGLVEVPTQHRLSILAACEDPQTISSFDYCGQVWPLPQTSQMWLEYELLTKPQVPGYFSFSTSYRQEANPVQGRHNLIFPMIEFELHGDLNDLIKFEKKLLNHLGYSKFSYIDVNYNDVCKMYETDELTHNDEDRLYDEFGPVVFLKNFPESTHPFWNMEREITGKECIAKKCDVILSGIETIGSAERSCDPEEMKRRFYSISNGEYANTLFRRFGKERVTKELDEFLNHTFIKRVGGGIGVTRLIRSLELEGLL